MILIALGANMAGPAGAPRAGVQAALARFASFGLKIIARSPLYLTRPEGRARGRFFVNAAVRVQAGCRPEILLARLHRLEAIHRRRRGALHAPRPLDLDLLDYNGRICGRHCKKTRERLVLPHPEMTGRVFVLRPLADIAPAWRHPATRKSAGGLLAANAFSLRQPVIMTK